MYNELLDNPSGPYGPPCLVGRQAPQKGGQKRGQTFIAWPLINPARALGKTILYISAVLPVQTVYRPYNRGMYNSFLIFMDQPQ